MGRVRKKIKSSKKDIGIENKSDSVTIVNNTKVAAEPSFISQNPILSLGLGVGLFVVLGFGAKQVTQAIQKARVKSLSDTNIKVAGASPISLENLTGESILSSTI